MIHIEIPIPNIRIDTGELKMIINSGWVKVNYMKCFCGNDKLLVKFSGEVIQLTCSECKMQLTRAMIHIEEEKEN